VVKNPPCRTNITIYNIYIYILVIVVTLHPRGDNYTHRFVFDFFYLKLKKFLTERFLEKLFYFLERPLDTAWEHEWRENYKLVLEWEHQGVGLGTRFNRRRRTITTRLALVLINGRGGRRRNPRPHHQIGRVRLGRSEKRHIASSKEGRAGTVGVLELVLPRRLLLDHGRRRACRQVAESRIRDWLIGV